MPNVSGHDLSEQTAWLGHMEWLEPWRADAECADEHAEVEWFFPDQANTQVGARGLRRARILCARCPVRRSCLEAALETGSIGVWAGTTEDQREATAHITPLEQRVRVLDRQFYGIVVRGPWRGVPRSEWRRLGAEGQARDPLRPTDVLGP